jgi:GTP-binding protein
MFVDHARIKVNGGNGGNGCCAFKREAYIPNGGPNGGDGGNGGDIYFVATKKLATLLDLSYHAHWVGNRGMHGKGSDCHGRYGDEMVIEVPCGTVVRDFHTGEALVDMVEDGQRHLAARGGKGGRGNARFATAHNRAPKFAEKGEPGDEKEYLLELKVIAEVGLVGLPNAGKSTLLAAITAARPKIADYPFTTLSPNLGVVGLSGHRLFTMADIPGIIEGAAEGKGLGHDFLRHIERTRVLLFLIDLGDEDPVATRDILESELERYSPEFRGRRRLYAFNKADITENRERFAELAVALQPAWMISAATHEGLDLLLEALWLEVENARQQTVDDAEAAKDAPEPDREYTYEAPFQITRIPEGFEIEGRRPIQAVKMTDFENEQAIEHLQHRLKKMGVFKALKRMGAQPGQTVRISGVDLDYQPD